MSSVSKAKLHQLIAENKIKEVLVHLRSSKLVQNNGRFQNEVLLYLNRFHSWQETERLGVEDASHLKVSYNQLVFSITHLVNEIVDEQLDLLALPPITTKIIKRPEAPFKGLHWFTREDAGIFFGRNDDIRELYDYLNNGEKLILLYGQSGVGKSSLLHAGLMPRLEDQWEVYYFRRNQEGGLIKILAHVLEEIPNTPTVIIIDQLEEIFTNPTAELEEQALLVGLLEEIIHKNKKVQFIFGFRKEYVAEIERMIEPLNLDHVRYFLEPLSEFGITEAITGATDDKNLSRKYQLVIKSGLPATIIGDILRDKASHIAPLLQILLRKMWDLAVSKKAKKVVFDHNLYEEVRQSSLESLLNKQLEELHTKFPVETDGGLALDILKFYTTNLATSRERTDKALLENYEHVSNILQIKAALIDLFILTDTDTGNRLAHDALGPIIHRQFELSDRLGQRARRMMESKRSEIKTASFKDADDINTLEKGRPFMRVWTAEEEGAFERGKKAVERQRLREQKMRMRNFEFSKERIEEAILHFDYNYAFEEAKKAAELNYELEQLARYFYEIAFFYTEINQATKALEIINNYKELDLGGAEQERKFQLLNKSPNLSDIKSFLEDLHPDWNETMQQRYYPQMVTVNAGSFVREGYRVSLNEFKIAKYPTTFWQYGLFILHQGKKIEELAPSWGIDGNNPVVNVSWYDAIIYANWLSEKMGKEKVYQIAKKTNNANDLHEDKSINWNTITNWNANGFRLPTEAEWEFAARGGNLSMDKNFRYAGSNNIEEVAWYQENAKRSMPVGKKLANGLGLFDMSGNVYEWCWDWKKDYPRKDLKNPIGPGEGEYRVLRGGSWYYIDYVCEVSEPQRLLSVRQGQRYGGFRLSQGF